MKFEKRLRKQGFLRIAGIDEAGRGPLAGPVVAAACIFLDGASIRGIDDSKKLSPDQRFRLYDKLVSHPSVLFGLGIVDAPIIDEINILQATFRAMLLAISDLKEKPDFLLVDGPFLPPTEIPGEGIVEGDALSPSIGAASILAKVTRDRLMVDYHRLYPQYGFDQHKGYGTAQHLSALTLHGPCPIHRHSFRPIKSLT
jgi:ribonuclease HII